MRMKLRIALLLTIVLAGNLFTAATAASNLDILSVYNALDATGYEKPPYDLFKRGVTGREQLRKTGSLKNDQILTLIDFRRSGNENRLWVIDMENEKILFYSLVAHGRNSGDVYATKFSNIPNSNQSSLGFYVTGKTYIGKHGISLILHGAEKGFNDQAESRSIVMHGADYVSESFIKRVGRLGRSFGCPAVPMEIHEDLIKKLAGGTCLYIYYPDEDYLANTSLGVQAGLESQLSFQ